LLGTYLLFAEVMHNSKQNQHFVRS